jgi:hypothetical protein
VSRFSKHWKNDFQWLEKRAYALTMVEKFIALVFIVIALAGCSTPKYEDGTKKEYSDMPWNTPARWEGSMNIPGMGGYE